MTKLKVFTCTEFAGHYPVGTAAVIVAQDMAEARNILAKELASRGLELEEDEKVVELILDAPKAIILRDGNY